MSTTITSENDVEIRVGQLGVGVVHPEGVASIWARLTPEQRSALADALDPGRQGWTLADLARLRTTLANPTNSGGPWTRDDLPSLPDVLGEFTTHELGEGAAAYRTAALAHLNAHHPKPDDQRAEYAEERSADLTRERDAAVARAEQAEMERERADREREEIADQFATFRAELVAEAVKGRESAVTRAEIEEQLRIAYESGNHPMQRIRLAADSLCALFGVEAEQAVDPAEELARQIENAVRDATQTVFEVLKSITGGGIDKALVDDLMATIPAESLALARRVLEQEASGHE